MRWDKAGLIGNWERDYFQEGGNSIPTLSEGKRNLYDYNLISFFTINNLEGSYLMRAKYCLSTEVN